MADYQHQKGNHLSRMSGRRDHEADSVTRSASPAPDPQGPGGERRSPPGDRSQAPTCFLCLGEGRTEREIEYHYHFVTLEYETCQMCGGQGVIFPDDLFECQGHGCGLMVTGETLAAMKDRDVRCRCKAPARRFCYADPGDTYYPKTADDLAVAVWSLEDLMEGTAE